MAWLDLIKVCENVLKFSISLKCVGAFTSLNISLYFFIMSPKKEWA